MGKTDEVKKLLDGGADVNEPNDVSRILMSLMMMIELS